MTVGEFALLVSLLQPAAKAPPRVACRDVAVTATLLREAVVPNWTTITRADLLRIWPGLQLSYTSLIANVDNIYCKEILEVQKSGGIRSMDLFFSGTRVQVLDAARQLSAALGFPLSDAEKKELEERNGTQLQQMNRVPQRILNVEVIERLNGNAADWGVRLVVVTFRADK
jgi:hypothetical protein